MRMSRRAVLHGIGGGGVSFSYTGTFDSFGDETQGFLVLKTSGTLTIKGTVDLCLVGGGGRGYKGWHTSGGTSVTYWRGGGGGAGGYVSNYTGQDINDDLTVTIGAGSSVEGSVGGQTSVGASFTANGGNSPNVYQAAVTGRGTSGKGGAASTTDATSGEDGIYPWDDSVNFSGYRVSGCGGGGATYLTEGGLGGAGGGGDGGIIGSLNGTPGTANTGGGGGGGKVSGSSSSPAFNAGSNGGSGVVFICWGYTH